MTAFAPYVPWFALAVIAIVVGVLRHQQQKLRHLRASQRLEQQHKERLAAIDKGLPVEEASEPEWNDPEDRRRVFESRVLLLGVVFITGGVGAYVGTYLVPRTPQTLGVQELASYALGPIGLGVGMLIYLVIARRFFND